MVVYSNMPNDMTFPTEILLKIALTLGLEEGGKIHPTYDFGPLFSNDLDSDLDF